MADNDDRPASGEAPPGSSAPRRRAPSDGAPAGATAQRLDPRGRILAAAIALIGESGWGRVTTRRVADRAGVNNALVHYYFGTKQALLVQAATQVLAEQFGAPIDAWLRGDDLAAGFDAVLAWFDAASDATPQARVLAEITVQTLHDPALQEVAARMLRELRAALAEALRAQGAEPAEAEGVAQALAALLDGLLFHRLIDPALDLTPTADAVRRLLGKETA